MVTGWQVGMEMSERCVVLSCTEVGNSTPSSRGEMPGPNGMVWYDMGMSQTRRKYGRGEENEVKSVGMK